MFNNIKSILFVVCAVMIFTAQTNRPDEKKEQHVPATRPAPAGRPVAAVHSRPQIQVRPQVQTRREPPQQVVQRSFPRVNINIPKPLDERRGTMPRVYGVVSSASQEDNRLFHHQRHNNWQPLYNFYDNEYHFYPYVNVTSPVEFSANYVTVLFNGQTYYFDRGSFYVQTPQGYLAVPPPIGIIVSAISQHAREIDVDGQAYYRYKGICYIQVQQGYQVVQQVQSDLNG